MFLIKLAFFGILILRASSIALTEVTACTNVQTPQILSARAQTSLGSLPLKIISIPLKRALVQEASLITFPSTIA